MGGGGIGRSAGQVAFAGTHIALALCFCVSCVEDKFYTNRARHIQPGSGSGVQVKVNPKPIIILGCVCGLCDTI